MSTSPTQCRFCGRAISTLDIRHRSPHSCCKFCVGLVSSLYDDPPPDHYALLVQKPSLGLRQLASQLTSKHGLQHKQVSGQDAVFDVVKTLRHELEDAIIGRTLEYSKDLILLSFLRLLNETFNLIHRRSQAGSQRPDESYLLLRLMSMNEKALESLIETCLILPAASYKNRTDLDTADIGLMFELAKEDWRLFQFVEDQLCIGIGACRLSFDDHVWHLSIDEDSQSVFGTIMNKLDLERERVAESTASQEAAAGSNATGLFEEYQALRRGVHVASFSSLNNDEVEFIQRIDNLHEDAFGYRYSELMLAYLLLIDRCIYHGDSRLHWDFASELTDYLTRKMPCDRDKARRIITAMSMCETKIPQEQSVFEFKRETRIARNPLVMIQVGQQQLCLYSASFLIRSQSHVSIEYCVGNHPLLSKAPNPVLAEIQRVNQSVKDYFVHSRVSPLLDSKGFKVRTLVKSIGGTNIVTPQCGEIDMLAYQESTGVILLFECKHTIHHVISARQIRNSISQYNDEGGFVDVLCRKVRWITANIDKVRREFGIVTTDLVCKVMFVTNLYDPASEFVRTFPVLDEETLKSLDSQQIATIAGHSDACNEIMRSR